MTLIYEVAAEEDSETNKNFYGIVPLVGLYTSLSIYPIGCGGAQLRQSLFWSFLQQRHGRVPIEACHIIPSTPDMASCHVHI